MKIYDWQ